MVEAGGFDVDGDPVQFEIAWQKNGQDAGGGNRLTAPVKRGDKVVVRITPFDGKDRGKSATLSREIVNTPPAIEGQERFQVDDNAVTFHVRASDADGDALAYYWEFGDGSTGTGAKVRHTYGLGGEYRAVLTVTAPKAYSSTRSQPMIHAMNSPIVA